VKLKGILVLKYHDETGSEILAQYPPNCLDELRIPERRISTLFEQTASKKAPPQFTQININKDIDILELYTGYSEISYIGLPDHGIVVLISASTTISGEFEGMVRRIAHDLLPRLNETSFQHILKDYFELLENEELNPYRQGDSLQPVQQEENASEEPAQDSIKGELMETKGFLQEGQVDKMDQEKKVDLIANPIPPEPTDEEQETWWKHVENQEIKANIEQLLEKISEQGEKIKDLSKYIIQVRTEKTNLEDKISLLEKKIDLQRGTIQELTEEKTQVARENEKLKDTISNLTRKIEELSKEINNKEKEIIKLNADLKEKDQMKEKFAEIEVLNSENETLKQKINELIEEKVNLNGQISNLTHALETLKEENNLHLDALASLKIEIKALRDKISEKEKERDGREEQLIELKKEIKVLRRERDHYKDIIKKNKLL